MIHPGTLTGCLLMTRTVTLTKIGNYTPKHTETGELLIFKGPYKFLDRGGRCYFCDDEIKPNEQYIMVPHTGYYCLGCVDFS